MIVIFPVLLPVLKNKNAQIRMLKKEVLQEQEEKKNGTKWAHVTNKQPLEREGVFFGVLKCTSKERGVLVFVLHVFF